MKHLRKVLSGLRNIYKIGDDVMKKYLIRGLSILIILLLILTIVFWSRISGSHNVYSLTDRFTEAIRHGNDELNFKLTANWGSLSAGDSLTAVVSYSKDTHFSATVHVNENHYDIQSDANHTQVYLSKSDIIVSGSGSEYTNFDILLLLGEIFQNHPQLQSVYSLSWIEKIGLATWSFFNCDFRGTEESNAEYQITELPEDLLGTQLELWCDANNEDHFRIIGTDSVNRINIELMFDAGSVINNLAQVSAEKQISVARAELNTSIYRGAVRAAGILLEDMIYPSVNTEENRWGKGMLTFVDGNRVFIAQGSSSDIGEAHGALLTKEVRKMVDATLYTIGWFYTIERGRWFIDDMREAYNRLEPFIPHKYQEEMAGLAKTSGISLAEVRLTNVFPALFHCSGFAAYNKATVGGKLYHGRVLDYMTRLGLQYHAVVFIIKPEQGYAFANIGYAGFIGSVSGMNEHQVAFGEMGGRGEGDWDGMPMAFLMREGLEKAKTLQEALAIFRDTPRTCEYYYVISDGKIPDARGLSTTPSRFELIKPNQFHELLPHPMEDAVLMSAGSRYEKLAERVGENYGKIDVKKAIELMDRPVAMKSNLHNVLFVPQSLEFWVANAAAHTPACNETYSRYSLSDLLTRLPD
jgi:hypothetical protein